MNDDKKPPRKRKVAAPDEKSDHSKQPRKDSSNVNAHDALVQDIVLSNEV